MKKNIKLIMLAFVVALLQACGGDDAATGTASAKKAIAKLDTSKPDGAFLAVVEAVKGNDVIALMQATMSKADFDKAVAEFDKAKTSYTEADKQKFKQAMDMLTTDGAVDNLMAMATPQLEQMRAQLPMMLAMGKGMAAQAIQSNPDIPANQKETTTKALNAVMDFLGENDVLSDDVTRKAISAAVNTAKKLDMKSLDDLQNMSFEQAMGKASIVMGGVKNVMGAYGISLDDMLSTIKVTDVQENGDTANMKLAFDFLGQTFNQDVKMVKKDGKWVAEK
ncbi:MAG TPA: hypothetical protein ENJ44_00520 [Oceanospirillales bacterium]|nr:hypothetical protein [Oceanospirillales bacterium]